MKDLFSLKPLANDEIFRDTAIPSLKKRNTLNNEIHPVKKIIKSFESPLLSIFPNKQHIFHPFTQTTNSVCNQCSNSIFESAFFCENCQCTVHEGCREDSLACCGSVGAIKLSLNYVKQSVLNVDEYQIIIQLLEEKNYEILSLIGKVSPHREDISRCLIRIFDSQYLKFLQTVLQLEIMQSSDSATLFRANSIGSKALDVFMKIVGQKYLIATLEKPLQDLADSAMPFEPDPSRLTSPLESNLTQNVKNLTDMVEIITTVIFDSSSNIPIALKSIFNCIQNAVRKKFPLEEMAKYTSVSGFLFLRFLTPAILGPSLFHIKIDRCDEQVKRKFTLIAKVIQSLSNLSEFGKKEPFMEPINEFIKMKIPLMKEFLESVSESDPNYTLPSGNYNLTSVSTDCADLVSFLEQSLPKLQASLPPSDMIPKLDLELKKVCEFRRSLEKLNVSSEAESEVQMFSMIPKKDESENVESLMIVNRVSGKLIEAKNIVLPPSIRNYYFDVL